LTPTADADTVVNDLHNLADKVAGDTAVVIGGTAQSRAMLNQVVDTLVLIVFTLLAVAVLIAIVGIANTLSLSVIERRAESALLRALGLTRGQMRGMLALEGIVIAGVTALLGLVIGIPFGLAGATLVLADTSTRALAVNPLHLGLGLALAIVAGLLASILPGRRAANTPPAAALAVE
jgi:putative ABC transport system permease protein